MRLDETMVGRSASDWTRCALSVSLLIAACGAGARADPDATGAQVEAGVDAGPDAAIDGGLWYDCTAACSRDPPIFCTPPSEAAHCREECRLIVIAWGCVLGETQRLLECFEEHPGACEEGFEGPCGEEWRCYDSCSNGDSNLVCRPPR